MTVYDLKYNLLDKISLIEKWSKKADEALDVFDRFIFRFVAYNATYNAINMIRFLLSKQEENYMRGDRMKAVNLIQRELKRDHEDIRSENSEQIQDILKIIRRGKYLYTFSEVRSLYDVNAMNGNDYDFLLTVSKKENSDEKIRELLESSAPVDIVEGLLTVVYNVRCNIVHGGKSIDYEQRKNVKIADDILKSIMKRLKVILDQKEADNRQFN